MYPNDALDAPHAALQSCRLGAAEEVAVTSSPPRTRILFVDDEPLFLHSLRSVMRKHRTMWDMSFASSAEEALELLAATPVDVVVSDMRMPHMDGAEFLRRVQELDPGAARLVLSGHADPEMLERAAPVAQQYLVKPCPSDRLHAVLERVCELQRTLDNQAVRERIGRVGRLPAISENYSQLSGAVARPRVDVAEIVAIVAREPAMSAKLLQLANSPYFQSGSPVTSVREAVGRLGLDLVVRLPMMLCAFGDSRVDSTGAEAFSPLELQQASIATARLAGKFAHNDHDRDLAFTAGLIHEIGRLLLVRESPEEMRAMVGEAAASGRPLTELERARLSTTHAEIGAYALGMWGLPIAVVEAVAYHHVIPAERRAELRIAALVHAADVLLEQALATPNGPPVEQLDLQTMDALGFTPLLPAWRQLATIEARSIRRA
jgi:HD-like signal output (HDOD) protein/CheY-like chemotaxis protein